MARAPHTSTTSALLEGLFNTDDYAVWQEFDRRYRPIVFGFACRLGLDEVDAADVAQETLVRFVQAYRAREYDRQRGRLRAWLMSIAKYRVADLQRARARQRQWRGESAILNLTDETELTKIWDAEHRSYILAQAIGELRTTTKVSEKTIEAFERVVLKEEPVKQVAADMGIKPQDIYVAKNRIAEKLRSILAKYEGLFDD
jgi:RNA polymerase sigma factor (sigma-70 family)